MNRNLISHCLSAAAVPALAGLMIAGAVVAAPQTEEAIAEIVVTAPRLLVKKVKGPHPTAGQEEVSVSLKVAYADLDLKQEANREVLDGRVKDAAKQICADLDELVPATASLNRDCVATTVAKAKPQIDLALAKAH